MLDNNYDDLGIEALEELRREKELNSGKEISEKDRKHSSNLWNQLRRLEFIDFRLGCDGKINRKDVVNFFKVSVPQASLDFTRYQELLSRQDPPRQNLHYDRRKKYYIKTKDYFPLFPKIGSADSYLKDLLSLSQGDLDPSRNFFGFVPNVGVATFVPPKRNVSTSILYNILDSIRNHLAVHISYISLKSVKARDNLIAPHVLAFDGLRWHIRAYCYDHHDFRDYVLSRVVTCDVPEILAPSDRFPDPKSNSFKEKGTTGADDAEWNEWLELVLRVNPDLPETSRRAIEYDYGMEEDGTILYKCRKALVFYALQWLRLTKEDALLPPERRQLILDNEAEVYRRMGW